MISQSRHKQMLSGLNGAARKLYDDVPVREPWTMHNIIREASRTRNIAPDVAKACLQQMVDSGLIKQTVEGFQRVPVKKAEALTLGALADLKSLLPQKEETMTRTIAPLQLSVIDKIGALAQQISAMAESHRNDMAALAHDLQNLAIEAQGELEKNDTELAGLRQLKALLKGLG